MTGSIQFHASGSAHVLDEKAGHADLYISAENTFTAMHGDLVVARLITKAASVGGMESGTAGPCRRAARGA